MDTLTSSTDLQKDKHWVDRMRESFSSITPFNNALRVSDVREDKQCCCCVNWYNDRKRTNKIKKATIPLSINKNKSQKIMIAINKSDAHKLKTIFKQYDTDKDGYLTVEDLGYALKQLGF
eukprot:793325_1